MLLEYERKRCEVFENRIASKDQLLGEMSALQNELYANIEELQNKLPLKTRDEEYIDAIQSGLKQELEVMSQQLHQKNYEISKINLAVDQLQMKERDYLNDISAMKIALREKIESKNEDFIHSLKRELQIKDEEIGRLNQDRNYYLNELQTKKTDNFDDLTILKKENSELAENILILTKKSEDKEMYIEQLKNLNSSLNKEIRELKNRVVLLNTQDKENFLGSTKTITSDFSKNETEEIGILKTQLEKLSTKINKKSDINELIEDLLLVFGISDASKIYPKVQLLLRDQEKNKNILDLYLRIESLIIQFSPDGTFIKAPTPHQIWK